MDRSKSIELLNKAVADELSAVHQYLNQLLQMKRDILINMIQNIKILKNLVIDIWLNKQWREVKRLVG
jgi:bacterioferritin (cytochrome b1)